MKKICLFVTIVFAFMSCNCQKKVSDQTSSNTKETSMNQMTKLPKLEYVANTRGFYQKISVENQIVTVSSDRNGVGKGESVKISDADLNELVSAFKLMKLDDLATYKDPTQTRFYDGAAIANLKVTDNGKEYKTTDFDHGFPPIEIEKLVNKIVSFCKK